LASGLSEPKTLELLTDGGLSGARIFGWRVFDGFGSPQPECGWLCHNGQTNLALAHASLGCAKESVEEKIILIIAFSGVDELPELMHAQKKNRQIKGA
jgi:hypothetical protein